MIQVLYKMADCTANVLIIPIVVMTASCFFGWTVSFTKKTTILLSVYALFVLFSDKLASLIMLVANPKLCEEIWMDNPDESTYQAYRVLFSSVSLFIVFLTLLCTFLCYLTAYESKKVLRAFLSSVAAYLTCQYVHNVLNYFYIYYTGGKMGDRAADDLFRGTGVRESKFVLQFRRAISDGRGFRDPLFWFLS